MCPGLAEPNNPLACILADQYLKLCDDRPSVVMPHTLNNQHNLNLDYLVTSFPTETPISETRANRLSGLAKTGHN